MAHVEVVYVPIDGTVRCAQVPFIDGMTVSEVLEASGLLTAHPECVGLPVGIFARMVSMDTRVNPGDRVELYRPLLASPMETRRRRAKK